MHSIRIIISLVLTALLALPAYFIQQQGIMLDGVLGLNVLFVGLAHSLSVMIIHAFAGFPGSNSSMSILPSIGVGFGLVFAVLALLHIAYSLPFFATALFFAILFCYLENYISNKLPKIMAFVPLGKGEAIAELPYVRWIKLNKPKLPNIPVQAIVVDLHSPELTDAWQFFLAEKTLEGLPIYNVRQVEESLTGRVKIHHMYENDLGSLLPSPLYAFIKMMIDIVLVLLSSPIVVPIMLVTAIVIKFDDKGPALFIQDRIGHRGKIIKVYKFRSMKHNASTQTTVTDDERITRVGRFIRKTRIDELPQFFNVLKGEMSLIGPRAEYKAFADELEKEVPFYQYRHIVRPGISGWAQVVHGYATGAEETQIKVEHDFYYIKHFSFSLDVLIFFKTIQTIFTGFGSR